MTVNYHQIALKNISSDCQDMFVDDTPSFFLLLEEHFNIPAFIPSVFYHVFYQRLGRKRDYSLTGFLSALILQKVFSIPTDSLLILLLSICKELKDFCDFNKVPDTPLFLMQNSSMSMIISATRISYIFPKFLSLITRAMKAPLKKSVIMLMAATQSALKSIW